jgi:hypothetical protein
MLLNKSIPFYIGMFVIIMLAGYAGNKLKNALEIDTNKDEYEMVKTYLLNDSPLYGYNRPKIWIHSKYEINARSWKNFQSRNSTDLNQPYLYLTIQSIINFCGNHFHICLIDDDSFEKLIPTWNFDLKNIADPMKSQIRNIGMTQLLYYYGGMVLPNSFLCTKNLYPLYREYTQDNIPFVAEHLNSHVNTLKSKNKTLFAPDIQIMGAAKNNETIYKLIEYLKSNIYNGHMSSEHEFRGDTCNWCSESIRQNEMRKLDGEYIGIKSRAKKQILLEDLMEEAFLDVDMNKLYGIYIPRDEFLRRPKYQWFSILPYKDILESNIILSKFFKLSMVDLLDQMYTNTSIISI